MLYDLLELLLGPLLTKQEQKMPKCKACKKRMEQMGPPRLFLLPVYSDGRYPVSADYFKEHCVPVQREEEIPTARRACRIWRLRCPMCGAQYMFVQDMSASFWVPAAQGRLHPSKVKMLGRSEFALCQDFCFAKMLVRRKRAAPPCGDPVGPASFLSTQDNPQSFAF